MDDLAVEGGLVWAGEWMKANLGVRDGRITTVTQDKVRAAEIVDARGLVVLPGIIDSHVHFALGVGASMTDDGFAAGSRAAAYGGVTTVVDFLDPVRTAESLSGALAARLTLASESCIDFGFHATLARPEGPAEALVREARDLGCPTIKVFTAYSSTDRRTSDRTIGELLTAGARAGTTVLVHAENESLMDLGGGTPVALHEESRPALCEVTAVLALAELVRTTGGRLYVVHVNCGTTVDRLKVVHPDLLGRTLFLETCPHYLLWDKGRYRRPDGGRYTMTPPLRSPQERRLLAENFGAFHTLATDHCAYHAAKKAPATTDLIPMGIGGVEFLLPSLWRRWGERCLPGLTESPARIHGLWPRKGNLGVGADADLVLFDPRARWSVTGHHGNADHSAWEGEPMRGRVVSTLSSGRFVVRDGEFLGGRGRFLRRRPATKRR